MSMSAGDLFAFLELDVAKVEHARPAMGATDGDPVLRALELATAEWSEVEAGAELARLHGRAEIRAGQTRLLAALCRSPFVEVRGIRAARVLWSALDQSTEDPSRM